jgi:hypothetical protein
MPRRRRRRRWLPRYRRRRCNCLVFVFWYWIHHGGWVAFRLSHPPLGIGWHWAWFSADRKRMLHYQPIGRKTRWWSAIFHKLWYRGRLRRYDTPWNDGGH